MEQFSVADTLTNFVGWLNSYGEAHQPDFKSSGKPAKFLGPSKVNVIHHTVTVGHGYVAGYIGFDILPVDATRLEVTAKTFSQMNVVGQLTLGVDNPYREELEQYFVVLVQAIRKRWTDEDRRPRIPDDLTEREQEVAALLARGGDDNDISEQLVISPHTSVTYRQRIFPKWGMDTQDIREMRIEAIRRGYRGD